MPSKVRSISTAARSASTQGDQWRLVPGHGQHFARRDRRPPRRCPGWPTPSPPGLFRSRRPVRDAGRAMPPDRPHRERRGPAAASRAKRSSYSSPRGRSDSSHGLPPVPCPTERHLRRHFVPTRNGCTRRGRDPLDWFRIATELTGIFQVRSVPSTVAGGRVIVNERVDAITGPWDFTNAEYGGGPLSIRRCATRVWAVVAPAKCCASPAG